MINAIFASLIAYCAPVMGLTDAEQDPQGSSTQVSYESQDFIRQLYEYIHSEGMIGIGDLIDADGIVTLSSDNQLENFSPGTILFLGSSETNIQTLVLCLSEGKYTQITSQDGNTLLTICDLADLDLSQYAYQVLYISCDSSSDGAFADGAFDGPDLDDEPAGDIAISQPVQDTGATDDLQTSDTSPQVGEPVYYSPTDDTPAQNQQPTQDVADNAPSLDIEPSQDDIVIILPIAPPQDEQPVNDVVATTPAFDADINIYVINEENLPLVISPKNCEMSLDDLMTWAIENQDELQFLISMQGAVLLRGFPIESAEDFAAVVKTVLGKELTQYIGEGSRTQVAEGVYTSTEAPREFKIPLHNELSCTSNPVDYICFYCDIAPAPGTGQTLLARTQDVTLAMMNRPNVWNAFNGKTITYISRHPSEGSFFTWMNPSHKSWQSAFGTTDRAEVERICVEKGYEFEWDGDWIEVTRYAPAILGPDEHFDYPYWFNQAYLYHMNPRICGGWINYELANILYAIPSTKQYDVEFADGTPITQEVVYEIYDALNENTIKFDWQEGDLLLIDNYQTLHGRAPCSSKRRILTTMVQ